MYDNADQVWYPVPWQVPPKRRYGLGVVLTVGIVAAIVAGAVGLLTGAALRPAAAHPVAVAAPRTPATTGAPAPDANTAADGKALLAKVIRPPAGTTTMPVTGSTGGVMDIDQFAAKFFKNSPDAAANVLRTDDFVVAAQREWRGADGVEVQAQLVAFATESDAERYVQSQADAYQGDEDVTATFAIPDVSLGNGFERSALDPAGNRRTTLVAQSTSDAVFLFFFTPHDFDRDAEIALMHKQLDALT